MAVITTKPYDQMSLAELREDYARWVALTRPGGSCAQIEPAHICRDIVATWIARREREEGLERQFTCTVCGAAVEFLSPQRRDAADLTCTCGGELVAAEMRATGVAA